MNDREEQFERFWKDYGGDDKGKEYARDIYILGRLDEIASVKEAFEFQGDTAAGLAMGIKKAAKESNDKLYELQEKCFGVGGYLAQHNADKTEIKNLRERLMTMRRNCRCVAASMSVRKNSIGE